MFIYLIIFITKAIENMLATVRIILIAKNRKIVGALLNGIISLIWIFSTYIVIFDINKDPFKVVFFCIGAVVGSYFGNVIEEHMHKEKKT
jgi:uncharacterized protein YebE (UPF0316 family)